jgi:hypothetical protein
MPGLKRIRIKKVSRVALLENGANLTRGLYKAAGATELTITPLAKSQVSELGLMHSIVYAPNMVDAHGHFMGVEDTTRGCHSHSQTGLTLDLHHDGKPLSKEKVYIAENFMLTGPDERFPKKDTTGREINHDGAWAQITHFVDPALRKEAREGKLGEVSLYAALGDFELEDVAESDLPSALKKSSEEDQDMKPEELTAAIEAGNAKLIAGLTTALTPLFKALEPKAPVTPEPPKKDEPPKPEELDPTNPAHLRKMQFNADMNTLYEEFQIDPTKAKVEVALLKGEDLESFTEAVEELRKKHGMAKASSRAGGTGSVRLGGGRNVPQDGSFDDWAANYGNEPLTKARREREKAGR